MQRRAEKGVRDGMQRWLNGRLLDDWANGRRLIDESECSDAQNVWQKALIRFSVTRFILGAPSVRAVLLLWYAYATVYIYIYAYVHIPSRSVRHTCTDARMAGSKLVDEQTCRRFELEPRRVGVFHATLYLCIHMSVYVCACVFWTIADQEHVIIGR